MGASPGNIVGVVEFEIHRKVDNITLEISHRRHPKIFKFHVVKHSDQIIIFLLSYPFSDHRFAAHLEVLRGPPVQKP